MTLADSVGTCLESALLARLPQLLTDVREGLGAYWPEYADFLETDRCGVEEAADRLVRRLLEMSDTTTVQSVAELGEGDQTLRLVFEQIGRRQLQEGNDLTRLLTAFQLGARTAWRHVSAAALEIDVPPDALAALADAVFVFVNQLSFASARGYVREQAHDARARERDREELAGLLLSDRAGTEAVHAAATRARWRPPAKAAVVLVDPHDEAARTVLDRLDSGFLPIRREDLWGAIVPDRAARQVANAWAGSCAAPTPWSAPQSSSRHCRPPPRSPRQRPAWSRPEC